MKKQQIDKIKKMNLATIDRKLQSMANEYGLCPDGDELNTTQASLSDEDRLCFLETVKRASHERALLEASKKVRKAELPFGRHLHTLRDKCGLTQSDIAKLLKKTPAYIEKIENGQVNPVSMLVADLADIMQLFRLTLSEFKSTATASLLLSENSAGNLSVMARSSLKPDTKERGDGIGHAMDAVLQAIAKKTVKPEDTPTIDASFLKSVHDTLKERDEQELLV